MQLFPAIDLRGGQAVRLRQGDFAQEQGYGDPGELAQRYLEGGARWLHVVDLDAARTGEPLNRDRVVEITELAHRDGARVQSGGGVRTPEAVSELLGAGVDRVVLGTVALEQPEAALDLARHHPSQVALGLDYRRREDGVLEASGRGWLSGSGHSVPELLSLTPDGESPWAAVIVTAIERDGTLAGPDLAGLRDVLGMTSRPVVASGGVGRLADLEALAGVTVTGPEGGIRRLSGAVAGRALVDGRLDLRAAVKACAASG